MWNQLGNLVCNLFVKGGVNDGIERRKRKPQSISHSLVESGLQSRFESRFEPAVESDLRTGLEFGLQSLLSSRFDSRLLSRCYKRLTSGIKSERCARTPLYYQKRRAYIMEHPGLLTP